MKVTLLHYNNNSEDIFNNNMISGYCVDLDTNTSTGSDTGTIALLNLGGNPYPYTKVFEDIGCENLITTLPTPMVSNNNYMCNYYWSRPLNNDITGIPTNTNNTNTTTDEQTQNTPTNCLPCVYPIDCLDRITFCSNTNNSNCCACKDFNQNTYPLWILGDCDGLGNLNKNITTRQMHWLNGGYFYANKNLRDYIYEENGTIHFSTNVKYDAYSGESSDNNTYDFVPLFDVGYGVGYLTLGTPNGPTAISFLASKLLKLNPIANSFGYDYSIFRLQNLKPIKVLHSTLRYNKITKAFDSHYNLMTIPLFNCGMYECENYNILNTKDAENIMVMLSTGNITHFPLTNEFVRYTQRSINTFLMTENLYRTYYYDFVTPIKNVYNSFNELVNNDISYGSYNAYLINNSFELPYSFVTTSVSITDGTNSYGNWKWRVTLKKDPVTNETYLNIDDAQSEAIMYNEFNESDVSEAGYKVLDRVLKYMKTNYSDLNIHLSLYKSNTSFSKVTLEKTTEILTPGTLYSSHIIENDPYDTREGQKRLRINISKSIPNTIDAGYTDTLKINGLTNSTFLLMLKTSSLLSFYRSNTSDVRSYTENILDNTVKLPSSLGISEFSEQQLFDITSSKFSTPDYTSISYPYTTPLRGSEYAETEPNNYPIIRYVRKNNGKFYVQIFAGAFPYYHSLIHYPAVKELEKCTVTMQNQGLCKGRMIENSLKKICSKATDWYNHIATTKWVCYIKHTEFGDDPINYIQTETEKQIIKGPNQKIYGSGKGKIIGTGPGGTTTVGDTGSEVATNPNTIGGSGTGISGGGISGGIMIGNIDRNTDITARE